MANEQADAATIAISVKAKSNICIIIFYSFSNFMKHF